MLLRKNLPCNLGCSSSDAMQEYENGWKCFSCDRFKKRVKSIWDASPEIIKSKITIENLEKELFILYGSRYLNDKNAWLYKYNLSLPSFEYVNFVGSSDFSNRGIISFFEHRQLDAIVFKVQHTNTSKTFLGTRIDTSKFGFLIKLNWKDRNRKPKTLLIGDCKIHKPFFASETIVIVEDIVSAYKIYQNIGKNTIALLGCGFNKEKLISILESKCRKIYLWLDPDLPGQRAALNWREKLDPYAEIINIISERDPKDHSIEEIYEYLK